MERKKQKVSPPPKEKPAIPLPSFRKLNQVWDPSSSGSEEDIADESYEKVHRPREIIE